MQPTLDRAVLDIHGDEVIEKTQVSAGVARIIRGLAKFSGQIDGDAFQGGCDGQARHPVIRGKRNDGVKAEAAGHHPEVGHVGEPIDIAFGGVARYGEVDQAVLGAGRHRRRTAEQRGGHRRRTQAVGILVGEVTHQIGDGKAVIGQIQAGASKAELNLRCQRRSGARLDQRHEEAAAQFKIARPVPVRLDEGHPLGERRGANVVKGAVRRGLRL